MESRQWCPSRWKPGKIKLYTMHVRKYATREFNYLLGPYNGALMAAEVRAWFDGEKSATELRARGIKLIGDAQNA